jgi:hypothetical protein
LAFLAIRNTSFRAEAATGSPKIFHLSRPVAARAPAAFEQFSRDKMFIDSGEQ